MSKNFMNLLMLTLLAFFMLSLFTGGKSDIEVLKYSDFINKIENRSIQDLTIYDNGLIYGVLDNGQEFKTENVQDRDLVNELVKNEISFNQEVKEKTFVDVLFNFLPTLLIIGFFYWMMKGQLGGAKLFSSPFQVIQRDQLTQTFNDVAGIDEIKAEVVETVRNFENSERIEAYGGKASRGILLTGRPGTGKTLLAKAMAKELNVNFIPVSGSQFVELFAGNGAKKVRELFELAKKVAPAMIFIDEIDAVGGSREDKGMGGAHEERIQTLNELLTQMDGFGSASGIFIVAATNFEDRLDPALTRAGRFDKKLQIPLPNTVGRLAILNVHLKKARENGKVSPTLDLERVARRTTGMTGADLASLCNLAIEKASKSNQEYIVQEHFDQAYDTVLMGVENKGMMKKMSDKVQTAYHEAGHAIIGYRVSKDYEKLEKVSIIPRNRALGVTIFSQQEDRVSHTKAYLNAMIQTMYGGRIAEEMIYGADGITTGASNDLERLSGVAYQMVHYWGFSKNSIRSYVANDKNQFKQSVSPERVFELEKEVDEILNTNFAKAKQILEKDRVILDNMTKALIKYETIDIEQIEQLMKGEDLCPEITVEDLLQEV